MFEKSLYDLIRGLRHHKGNEREYIQNNLRECRAEIKGQDMDVKATALLKLVYLEMFGHDMSWASFNVLEVMSSAKYVQKRVGYLGAVQSFRPETEVLMLATNLLKKDVTSATVPTIYLPLITVPHIITPSLALSLLPDIMPRLSHSSPNVRKKSLVALYRLALVYPETLRPAWPKIKAILMDDGEDSSVTAASINVVCELGWRRPQDFLPLAPRLFDLLVDSGNNWMAIKIIKLFATLTPLEPRLIKKLLPPLTNLIRTTTAMSLLYECIHGIIQGGILNSGDTFKERDEVAELCVSKLQEMVSIEGDPNLKYVALLSFNSISLSHPHLVATHQAIIFDCLDDPDISIRSQALVLCSRMINSENIVAIIDKLLQQIRTIPVSKNFSGKDVEGSLYHVEPVADSDGEDPTETLKPDRASRDEVVPLPHEYCISVIESIIDMCSRDTYSNILDFNWYLDILLELVGKIPQDAMPPNALQRDALPRHIGAELRNVAVRVISVRAHAVSSAASLLEVSGGMTWPTAQTPGTSSILAYAAWIVGEYADYLSASTDILEVLLYHGNHALDAEVLCAFLQAIPKVLVRKLYLLGSQWDKEQRAVVSLLFARVIQFLDILAFHPSLDVQERATEFLELFRVSREAIYSQERDSIAPPPLLLTAVFPSLFIGMVLGPVSGLAQRKVPMPAGLDLESPLNSNLPDLLIRDEVGALPKRELVDVHRLYYQKPAISVAQQLRESSLLEHNLGASEVQRRNGDTEQQMSAYQKLHRNQRTRDDPYYIGKDDHSNRRGLMQIEDILRSNNDQDVDIDAIPIMDLDLGGDAEKPDKKILAVKRQHTATSRVHITADENIDGELTSQHDGSTTVSSGRGASHQRRGFLQINATGIGDFTMEHADDIGKSSPHMGVRGVEDDHEMTRALAEVETLRMEMQRAAERVEAGNIPDEGTLVKKKTKKPKKKLVQGEPSHNTKNDLVRNTKRDVEYHGRGEKQKKNKRKKASEPHVVQAA